MTGMDKAELLERAYAQLGLVLVYDPRRGKYVVYDSDANEYDCFAKDALVPALQAPTNIEVFLKVSYFEYYRFPGGFRTVKNVFFGMSREELELRLAVMGK